MKSSFSNLIRAAVAAVVVSMVWLRSPRPRRTWRWRRRWWRRQGGDPAAGGGGARAGGGGGGDGRRRR